MGESETTITLQIIIIGMIMLFVLALAVILFFIIYQKRLLAQQKKHQEIAAEYQRELLGVAIESQEKERTRIGKELHDDVGALLTTTKLYLSQVSPELSAEELTKTTEKMRSLFDAMIQGVRNISQDLRPVILEKLGLIEAVENLVQTVNDVGTINATFNDFSTSAIAKADELNVYRIMQELINNTLKHAMASNISIAFSNEGTALKITYKDDGIGLQQEYLNQKGIGLRNIESRLSVLAGTIHFNAQKTGMKAIIKIPI
ncbi:Oxygen sensor histidine kinase NreB [Kordia antarctica]|uniref:histidine kinase n=1 Tax=Kordia antarctica TaxID=1218801 RepID=A0A7L4ZPF2_9FLAO|nr:histidine kinase [Kordia antarctica]QHI38329.1 Oxygen sensor histidine kinase NreB [Kordia antarctica]